MTANLPILCDKCAGPLPRNLVTLPYEAVAALRERIAQLEADAKLADRTINTPPEPTP